jgi:hypothetical protein
MQPVDLIKDNFGCPELDQSTTQEIDRLAYGRLG